MKSPLLRLHPTVLVLAATHFVVDGYGNILAPLLPLLILNLDLSLAAAGTLQMCFQLANSVAQLGFGHIADRWRPRVLLLAGPVLCVMTITLIGLAPDAVTRGGDGYLRVHYERLGLKFLTYRDWLAAGAQIPASAGM